MHKLNDTLVARIAASIGGNISSPFSSARTFVPCMKGGPEQHAELLHETGIIERVETFYVTLNLRFAADEVRDK